MEKSSDTEVALRGISESAAGSYKCEVSGEGPEFWTAFKERNVSVVGKLGLNALLLGAVDWLFCSKLW